MTMTIPQEISADTSRIDPITHEVIRHRLWSINDEGSTTIIHTSGSPVVHATDYNFGIYTSKGDIAVTGVYYMLPTYAITLMIRKVIEKFGDDISPGDVFITNDPFTAAVHQNDVQFVAPFFYQDKLIAWTGYMAHILDVGGMEPGSWCPKATDCYQEGLLIPVSRIVERGTINQALWELILTNTRLPFFVANNFSAFLSAHRVTHTRLQAVCDRYGADTLCESMRTSILHSEQQVRKILTSLPDGTFEHIAYLDHDGHGNNVYRISCKLTKSGDHLIFDFRDTDPQITGMGNATRAGTWGAVATMMLSLFGSSIEWNAGLLEPVTILFGDKTALSAEAPSPISGGSVGAAWIALVCVASCIAKMLGFSQKYADYIGSPSDGAWSLAQFAGLNQYGEPFATMYMDSGGWGGAAFRFRDGINTGRAMLSVAGRCNDVEQQENRQPFLYLWRRELLDSGGAGRFRGGNGLEYSLALLDSPFAQATLASPRIGTPPKTRRPFPVRSICLSRVRPLAVA